MKHALMAALVWLFAVACSEECPPAEGFDVEGSDARAVEIAGEVMTAMGGCENWDKTHYIAWNFFGRRFHVWDKWSGNIRVESEDGIVIMNLRSREGRAWENGVEVTDPDALIDALAKAHARWINDSYWLVMPYKMKDSGVTLKYVGEGKTEEGADCDILELTFRDVGVTPDNKYHVYVDRETHLVTQWDYYDNASDAEPALSTPWQNWRMYGDILLSGGRGERGMSEIIVFDKAPDGAFEGPGALDLTGGHH